MEKSSTLKVICGLQKRSHSRVSWWSLDTLKQVQEKRLSYTEKERTSLHRYLLFPLSGAKASLIFSNIIEVLNMYLYQNPLTVSISGEKEYYIMKTALSDALNNL